jgi:predicted aspartyl protease
MGYVYADLTVRGRKEKKVKALVDTGASYVVLDPQTVAELEFSPTAYNVELTLADRQKARAQLFLGEAEVEGRKGPIFVAQLDVPVPLLGVFALETLGLRPDPLTGKLEVIGPEGGYLLLSVGE